MMCVTRADHDTDRLDQSMTVNGYDLVSIQPLQPACSLGVSGTQLCIRPGVLR